MVSKLLAPFILIIFLASCSGLAPESLARFDDFYKESMQARYDLVDKAGKFVVVRESGYRAQNNRFFTKSSVYPEDEDRAKLLEESFVISNPGMLSKKLKVMRPFASRYNVWFEGKKFTTEMYLNEKEKGLEIKMTSPESQWNGTKNISLPQGTGVYCFLSQLVECVRMTGFFHLSAKNDAGVMNFHLIWEGYPYYAEQYLYVPDEPISQARLTYDGVNNFGETRFTLEVGEQRIFYFVDKEYNFLKRFWVAQGLSQTRVQMKAKAK